MNATFSWKPALLHSAITWRLDNGILVGPDISVDLANVTSLCMVDHYIKGTRIMRLDLLIDGETATTLSHTATIGISEGDPDFDAFWACVNAIADALALRNPSLPVIVGEAGKTPRIFLAIGVFAVFGGIGLLLASLLGIGGARGLSATLVPILALIGFGIAISISYSPWRKRTTLPVSTYTTR